MAGALVGIWPVIRSGHFFRLISWRPLPPIHIKSFAMNAYHDGTPDWPYPLDVIQVGGQMPFWEEASRLMRPAAHLVGAYSLFCFYMSEALPNIHALFATATAW